MFLVLVFWSGGCGGRGRRGVSAVRGGAREEQRAREKRGGPRPRRRPARARARADARVRSRRIGRCCPGPRRRARGPGSRAKTGGLGGGGREGGAPLPSLKKRAKQRSLAPSWPRRPLVRRPGRGRARRFGPTASAASLGASFRAPGDAGRPRTGASAEKVGASCQWFFLWGAASLSSPLARFVRATTPPLTSCSSCHRRRAHRRRSRSSWLRPVVCERGSAAGGKVA